MSALRWRLVVVYPLVRQRGGPYRLCTAVGCIQFFTHIVTTWQIDVQALSAALAWLVTFGSLPSQIWSRQLTHSGMRVHCHP